MADSLLVFDLDGTLVDSAPDLLATLDAILPRYGFAAPRDPRMRDGIGHGARHLIEYALHQQQAAVDAHTMSAMHQDFLAYYEANICVESRLYPGTIALLDRFEAAGFDFAVCTNKLEGLSRHVLDELRVADRFTAICGGDTFANRKPHPSHLLQTISAAGGAPGKAVMIGDSRTDLDTARAAGVPFIGVSYGYTPVPMAELNPDLLLDSFDEFTPKLIAGLLAGSDRSRIRRASATAAVS